MFITFIGDDGQTLIIRKSEVCMVETEGSVLNITLGAGLAVSIPAKHLSEVSIALSSEFNSTIDIRDE